MTVVLRMLLVLLQFLLAIYLPWGEVLPSLVSTLMAAPQDRAMEKLATILPTLTVASSLVATTTPDAAGDDDTEMEVADAADAANHPQVEALGYPVTDSRGPNTTAGWTAVRSSTTSCSALTTDRLRRAIGKDLQDTLRFCC